MAIIMGSNMARYPGAKYVGADPANYSTEKITPTRFVVHIAQGSTIGGLISWFHNPNAKVSAHFGNPRWLFGKMVQFVDTDEMAYHCANFNSTSIGCENVGMSGQRLSLGQRRRLKKLAKWINQAHPAIPLEYTGDPNAHGFIGHGKLPEGVWSHPDCPGEPVLVDTNVLLFQLRHNK
jgi:N-acetyl-anhydromuramyl-L-alanine amidase AmpD